MRPSRVGLNECMQNLARLLHPERATPLVVLFCFHKDPEAQAAMKEFQALRRTRLSQGSSSAETCRSQEGVVRVKAKVKPPKMTLSLSLPVGDQSSSDFGKERVVAVGRTGVFACRSPHRPSPVGLSICSATLAAAQQRETKAGGESVSASEKRKVLLKGELPDLQRASLDCRPSRKAVFARKAFSLPTECCAVSGADVITGTPVIAVFPLEFVGMGAVAFDSLRFASWIRHPFLCHIEHRRAEAKLSVEDGARQCSDSASSVEVRRRAADTRSLDTPSRGAREKGRQTAHFGCTCRWSSLSPRGLVSEASRFWKKQNSLFAAAPATGRRESAARLPFASGMKRFPWFEKLSRWTPDLFTAKEDTETASSPSCCP